MVVISRTRGTITHRIMMSLVVVAQMNVFYSFSCLPEGAKTEENCSLDEEERRELDLLFVDTPSASQTQNPAALPPETSDNQTERQGYVPDADLAAIVGNEEQFRYQVCNRCEISNQMNKRLWKYIYTHDLLSENTVKCDETLQKVQLPCLLCSR